MMCSILRVVVFTSIVAVSGGPGVSVAQTGGFAPRWPDAPMPPSTGSAAPPAAAPTQAPPAPARSAPAQAQSQEAPSDADSTPPQKPKPAVRRADVVQCQGPFARDTSEAKLIAAFGAKNVVFEEVSGPEGSKLNATVLFPNDRKRRLEVLWIDEETRTKPASIVIEGSSSWVAPKGVKVGTPLSEVERLNGKSFKLSGFGGDNGGQVTDWQGGAMTKLAGGCALGVKFSADDKASADAQGKVAGDKTLVSNEGGVRAVRPRVNGIFIGYAPP